MGENSTATAKEVEYGALARRMYVFSLSAKVTESIRLDRFDSKITVTQTVCWFPPIQVPFAPRRSSARVGGLMTTWLTAPPPPFLADDSREAKQATTGKQLPQMMEDKTYRKSDNLLSQVSRYSTNQQGGPSWIKKLYSQSAVRFQSRGTS